MMSGNDPNLNMKNSIRPTARIMYLAIFIGVSLKFLNFNEIMLIGLINRKAKMMVNVSTTPKLCSMDTYSDAAGMNPRKRALAGVGIPMNFSL